MEEDLRAVQKLNILSKCCGRIDRASDGGYRVLVRRSLGLQLAVAKVPYSNSTYGINAEEEEAGIQDR